MAGIAAELRISISHRTGCCCRGSCWWRFYPPSRRPKPRCADRWWRRWSMNRLLRALPSDFGILLADVGSGRAADRSRIAEPLAIEIATYEGTLEVIGASSKVSIKRWDYRRIGSFGDSKAVLRFTAPAEVKGVALLIVNHPDRASDQWMWTPAIERDRRIAAAGPFYALLRHRLQLRRSGRARCRSVRLQAAWATTPLMARPAGKSNRSRRNRSRRNTLHRCFGSAKITMRLRRSKILSNDKLIRRIHYSDIQNVEQHLDAANAWKCTTPIAKAARC